MGGATIPTVPDACYKNFRAPLPTSVNITGYTPMETYKDGVAVKPKNHCKGTVMDLGSMMADMMLGGGYCCPSASVQPGEKVFVVHYNFMMAGGDMFAKSKNTK